MAKITRCAIYTRKSTEEGLEQDFNSLDAQREAGEAYIKSQMHEGWEVIKTQYNDGGFSGGNIERPALRQLMYDIEAGKIDIVVVYKVDRLSRSLGDFAKLVDIFDRHKVSFVSVTQQFNTTTSMGRLTLNILLSFAQFEREVTGERIRDKFAASKEKGMWMGGNPQLGYDVKNRHLVINEQEAELVRYIYEQYLSLKSVNLLEKKLRKEEHRNKSWESRKGNIKGGSYLTDKNLYTILSNPLYLGKTYFKKKKKIYEGQHEAIIDQELWDIVQKQTAKNRVNRKTEANNRMCFLLRGKCYDIADKIYTTTYTSKSSSARYGYYMNKYSGHRIGNSALEKIVLQMLKAALLEESMWLKFLANHKSDLHDEQLLHKLQNLIWNFESLSKADQQTVIKKLIEKIIILEDKLTIKISGKQVGKIVSQFEMANSEKPEYETSVPALKLNDKHLEISMAVHFENINRRKQAVDENGDPVKVFKEANYDMTLIKTLAKSYRWNKMLENGEVKSISEIAKQEKAGRAAFQKSST